MMPVYQSAIFDKSRSQHLFMEFSLRQNANFEPLRDRLRCLLAEQYQGDVVPVIAFGHHLWGMLDNSFEVPVFSFAGNVPETQGDLLVWLQSNDRSELYDAQMTVLHILREVLSVQLEMQCFVYHDMRDLTGFIDGIGNPKGNAVKTAALVKDGHPGAGGSFVLTQKWVHKLDDFNQLDESEQENVIGRTKADAVEFDEQRMPPDAHVSRTDIDHDGVPQKIWRRSVPYGNAREQGLYFVAFSCELGRFDYLLRNMYGMNDGIKDRLLEFSQPVTSSWWFAPTQDWLAGL